jgi:serine phosphatase RsbU (regulator of sigma subunit)
MFQRLNLRLAQSVTARNALGRSQKEAAREIATMLYGEVRPNGYFRFVNFGHPPPLVYSAEFRKFVEIDRSRMVQFTELGLEIPEDHPDRNRYFSLQSRQRPAHFSDIGELTLMSPGDILFLYTDGVYDGSDDEIRQQLEGVMRDHFWQSAKEICNALLDSAEKADEHRRQIGDLDLIDDKTVFIIKRSH